MYESTLINIRMNTLTMNTLMNTLINTLLQRRISELIVSDLDVANVASHTQACEM